MDTEVFAKTCRSKKKSWYWCVCTDTFMCPRCGERVYIRAYWKPNANFRTSVCGKCGTHICLKFNDDSCERCRSRTPNCLLKIHLRVHVLVRPKIAVGFQQVAIDLVALKYLEFMKK